MHTLDIGNGTVTVEHEGPMYTPWDGERQQYKYVIRTEAWEYVGNDICSGVSDEPDERKAMGTLLVFLSACAEARSYGNEHWESWDLFPDHVGEWCGYHADEIDMTSLEFEEVEA